jgi:hypothetical protein
LVRARHGDGDRAVVDEAEPEIERDTAPALGDVGIEALADGRGEGPNVVRET